MIDDRSGWASWLAGKEKNVTSQFGEDGLVAAALGRIGIKNQWCFEVGANDGLFYSNTKWMRDDGWNAVLIESVYDHFKKLESHRTDKVHCIHATVGPGSLDQILATCGAPEDLDFGVIDIDGQDYWVWKGMERYRPRLMLVEFCPSQDSEFIPPLGDTSLKQATLGPILALGTEKGYRFLAKTQVNILFGREDCL